MKTHVDVDEGLLLEVIRLGNFPTKRAAIDAALHELSRALKRHELLALRGKVAWEGDLSQLRVGRDEASDNAR